MSGQWAWKGPHHPGFHDAGYLQVDHKAIGEGLAYFPSVKQVLEHLHSMVAQKLKTAHPGIAGDAEWQAALDCCSALNRKPTAPGSLKGQDSSSDSSGGLTLLTGNGQEF